jgi:hypothetical protein
LSELIMPNDTCGSVAQFVVDMTTTRIRVIQGPAVTSPEGVALVVEEVVLIDQPRLVDKVTNRVVVHGHRLRCDGSVGLRKGHASWSLGSDEPLPGTVWLFVERVRPGWWPHPGFAHRDEDRPSGADRTSSHAFRV